MNTDIESAKEKIAKLFNLADNDAASRGEIEAALEAATRLLNRYHLTREDVVRNADGSEDLTKVRYARGRAATHSSKVYAWEGTLAHFVTEFLGSVQVYGDHAKRERQPGDGAFGEPKPRKGYIFYGPEEDVLAACELYFQLSRDIASIANLRWGGAFKSNGGTYCQGFVAGLREANFKGKRELQAPTVDATTYALVVQSQERQIALVKGGSQWLAKQGVHLGRSSGRSGARGSSNAYHEGRADGARYGVSRPGGRRRLA